MVDKLQPLSDAVRSLIKDQSSVVLGACLEPDIPFAVTYEIIRQGIKGLDIIAPISDASTDMLIGAGAVGQITGAWVGNVSGGLGHNYRRAFEGADKGHIQLRDHSNFSLGMALMAGAYGMPYAPMRSILGSDILKSNDGFKMAENPFVDDPEPIVLVEPLTPDVAVLCVQRADSQGNHHHWGSRGLMRESGLAAEKVIVLADEIVAPEVIASDPERVLIPGHLVTAVCHVKGAVHPSPMTGCWNRDNVFFNNYHERSRTVEGFNAWLDEWVYEVRNHGGYVAKLGSQMDLLRITGQALSAPANYAAR